jgi:ADP-heptose:LPS heptosyltransferase
MKTLVIQLARLGDIYQSWPTLNALKKSGQEVHLLTRSSFAQAAPSFIDRHWCFETKAILKPLIDERPNVDEALDALKTQVEALKAEKFDQVINLTYSPFSASLTHELGCANTIGYSRHDDRTLHIPDDASAYFYAQVGVGKQNRLHVIDLFAHTAGVMADWSFPKEPACPLVTDTTQGGIVVHLGASDLAKTLSWPKWLQVVKALVAGTDAPVILVGSKEEAEIAEKVSAVFGARKPINLVGRTNLKELHAIIEAAALVVGGDSAPVQVASLTNTKVFNLSFPMVNLWETGPRSAGSRILPLESEDSYTSEEIAREILACLHDRPAKLPVVTCAGQAEAYQGLKGRFEWDLIQALYMGELFPPQPSDIFMMGLQRLEEVNMLAIEQIAAIQKDSSNQTASLILDRVDDVMEQIMKMVPETQPLVGWFRTERLRIAPQAVEQVIEATRTVHARLGEVLSLYLDQGVAHEVAQLDKK